MTVEVVPFGNTCQIACRYCYQNPMRDAGNLVNGRYSLERMKAGLEKEGAAFTIFGGEPLLMPLDDLEEMWRWGLERFAKTKKDGENVNALQTNGALIRPEHIAMFRKYRVGVGISVDGPGELNDARWAGSEEKTRAATAATDGAIRALCADGQPPSIIVTLHRLNASAERLPRLKDWFRELDRLGVRHARLHPLEVDSPAVRDELMLDDRRTVEVFVEMAALETEIGLRFDAFADVEKLLAGTDGQDDHVTCTFNACDPATTDAVSGIDGQGERTNCGRTNKDGINWRKADQAGFERQLVLYRTPQADGGCAGCRFFFACKGQCPGTAIDGDWRNRSEGCPLWMATFALVEARMVAAGKVPWSLRPELPALEERLLGIWAAGRQGSIGEAIALLQGRPVPGHPPGEHGDWHGDAPHGDSDHGDSDHPLGSREKPLGLAKIVRRRDDGTLEEI